MSENQGEDPTPGDKQPLKTAPAHPAPLPTPPPAPHSPTEEGLQPPPHHTSTTRILRASIDEKIAGSYICIEKIAEGGMGVIYRGMVNPYIDFGERLKEPASTTATQKLRKVAGVDSPDEHMSTEQTHLVDIWVLEQTAKLVENPRMISNCEALLQYVNPRRARFIGKGLQPAIKFLKPEFLQDDNIVERFRREIKIMEDLDDHPNIVKVVESGKRGKQHYVVMEYVDAIPLDKEAGKLPIHKTTMIIQQALEGLVHAHSRDILHRDIKPENILVSKDFKAVKLTDFGIAKALESTDGNLTKTQEIVGSGFYLDPERFSGNVAVKKSDVYSLGATFYKLLTGKPPTRGTTFQAIMYEFSQKQEPAWVRKERPEVSEKLEDVVMMMLSKDLATRPTTTEVKILIDTLEMSNQLVYRALTAEEQARDKTRAAELQRIIRTRSRTWPPSRRAADRTRILIAAYELWGDLQPRTTPAGINARINAYETARVLYHAAVENPNTASITEALKQRAALLEKKRALEYRRLKVLEFEREIPQVKSRKKPILVGLTTLAALGLGGYISFTAYTTHVKQVHQQQEAERLNNERYAEALRFDTDVQTLIQTQEYFRAKQTLDGIAALLAKMVQPHEDLRQKMTVLQARAKDYAKPIEAHTLDLVVYRGIVSAFAEVEQDYLSLEKQHALSPTTLPPLKTKLAKIHDTLLRAVTRDGIGKEEYAERLNTITALQEKIEAYDKKEQK